MTMNISEQTMERLRIASTMITVGVALVFALPACDDVVDDGFRRRNYGSSGDGTGDGADTPGDPTMPGSCNTGTPYIGFDGEDLTAARAPGGLAIDRRRMKPFTSLSSEMSRVLGSSPASLTTSAAAFGDVPARWYAEPVSGAVSLFTNYSVAFTGCYDTMGDAAHATAPTAATAQSECSTFARKAWLRAPTAEETSACVDLLMTKLANESNARRRWAHMCAAIMTSAGFVSY